MINLHQSVRTMTGFVLALLLIFSCITLVSQTTVNADSRLSGVALKNPTNVYQKSSANSKVLKEYAKGSVLVYEKVSNNNSWFSATVYINGKWKKGYISKSDVETSVANQKTLKGVALKSPTVVYSEATTNSSKLKSYIEGSILVYRTFTSNWYEANVYSGGKWRTGYIHKSHVENAIQDQKGLYGLGLKNPTVIYTDATTNSSKLKSYNVGSKLYFKSFSNNWYEATVYVNGKWRYGYIHHSHVEPAAKKNTSYEGIAQRNPTPIYKEASSNGGVWKSYSPGSILVYESFSKNWYQATVYANGNWRTGFIHHSHVENAVKDQQTLYGIGTNNPTTVYAEATATSKELRSYATGSILKFETFSSNWYEATIFSNGEPKTGYIHTNHVEEVYDDQKSLEGRALKSPTNVYVRASKSSKVLKDYPENSNLIFKTFSPNWYQATVYVNGKPRIGYIYHNDVTTEDVTNITRYDYTFKRMVEIQMASSPKGDGAGTTPATREQVEYYANPSNFNKNSSSYYQFLDLSQPAGLNAKEINNNILYNKGSLKGTGQAFIDAGKNYNINEAYLIAHTLHETDNGNSTLASGVPVNENGDLVDNPKNAAHTVYNMYGYGAKDSCPLKCGAKYAFDHGWLTPSAAVLGGASQVSKNYIQNGQDTLFKMRWNPDNPGSHQYATHVSWAVAQTSRISEIYELINNYTLVYDVPRFLNQPSTSGDPNATDSDSNTGNSEESVDYPNSVYGITNTGEENLNFRDTPDGEPIGKIPNDSKVEVIGTNENEIWLKVNYNNKTGWVHGDFVNILNLLKAKTTVNIRNAAKLDDASDTGINLTKGTLVSIVLANSSPKKIVTNGYVWYKINYNGKTYWVSSGPESNPTEFISVIK